MRFPGAGYYQEGFQLKINHVIPLMLVFVSLLIGGIGQAYAICQPFVVGKPGSLSPSTCHPPNPNPPVQLHATYNWGSVNGAINQSSEVATYQTTVTGYPGTSATYSVTNGVPTTVVNLTDSILELTPITYNGSAAFQLYAQYSPTSDSGTFIFSSTNGALLEGNVTALTRLRQEIINADPDFFSAMDAIPSSFWSQYLTTSSSSIASSAISPNFSFDQALACGAFSVEMRHWPLLFLIRLQLYSPQIFLIVMDQPSK